MGSVERLIREIENDVAQTRRLTGIASLDPAVIDALRRVPRHEFVPATVASSAYQNHPLPIGYGQTISQPFIVALMTELVRPSPGSVVLEIGAGCGYQSAVLAELVDRVYAVEVIPELAEEAAERLRRLGYANVEVRVGDGYFGWPEHAPYDAIVVTAATPIIPPPLVDQLKPSGRLVLPLGQPHGFQELVLVNKDEKGELQDRPLLGVAFVPLTGRSQQGPWGP